MEQVMQAKQALDTAAAARKQAMQQRDAAVVQAILDGVKRKLIAETLGVTQARISEIWKAGGQSVVSEAERAAMAEAGITV